MQQEIPTFLNCDRAWVAVQASQAALIDNSITRSMQRAHMSSKTRSKMPNKTNQKLPSELRAHGTFMLLHYHLDPGWMMSLGVLRID